MGNLQEIGVSKAVREDEVAHLPDATQDGWIATILAACATDLEDFVGHARPREEIKWSVTGPHDDPIQGKIFVHKVSAMFDLDDLPSSAPAYRVYVHGDGSLEDYQGPTVRRPEVVDPQADRPKSLDDLTPAQRDLYRRVYRERFGKDPEG